MAQSVQELKHRVENVDLWPESTNDDRCDNCKFYKVLGKASVTALTERSIWSSARPGTSLTSTSTFISVIRPPTIRRPYTRVR